MALNRVPYPANLTAQADFSAHGTLIETGYLDKSFAPLLVLGGEIPQGIVLQIGGVVYRADSAETVTGSSSKYIRIVPAGATATANYVTDLTGVSWNAQYNGYYDGSGNLYIFDENQALYDGAVGTVKTRFVQQSAEGDVFVGRDLAVKRNLEVTGNANVEGSFNSASVVTETVDTGQGANELYAMDQALRTTDAVTFATVDTGHGANELYPMDQGVRTTDDVQFNILSVNDFNFVSNQVQNAEWSTPTALGGRTVLAGQTLLGWRIAKSTGVVDTVFVVGPGTYGTSSSFVYLLITI